MRNGGEGVRLLGRKRKTIDVLEISSLTCKEIADQSIQAKLHCWTEKESVGVSVADFKNVAYLLSMPNVMHFLLLH